MTNIGLTETQSHTVMGVYEENIIPIKIAHLAEYVARVKRISLDDALVYIYVNPMYERLYDETLLNNPEWNIRHFDGADEPWLYFVTDCRKSRKHDYDLVLGPVANDKVFTTVNLFESGILSAEVAILQLKAYKTYDQLSFHTARTIGTLRFVEAYEV